jgi:arsenate reductase
MKKAFVWLEENGFTYEFVDYKRLGVIERHLEDWNLRAGWQMLLNTHGLTWKKLGAEERAGLDEAKALALLREYSSLVKRPVLDSGEKLLVGFDPLTYAKELKR